MKKFYVLAAVLLAACLSLTGPAEGERHGPWTYYEAMDSIDAETDSTSYIDMTRGGIYDTNTFQVVGFCRMSMSGATDGAFDFEGPIRGQDGTLIEWQEFMTQRQDNAPALGLGMGNNRQYFYVCVVTDDSGEGGIYQSIIFGDSLMIEYDHGTVTGGHVSIYLWIRPVFPDQ